LSRGCDQVVVLVNTSLLCLPANIVYVAANALDLVIRTAHAVLTFCDADIDSAEIEGVYERASDIYDQNVDIDGDLVAHDLNIDTDLMTHDAEIKALLATALGKLDQVIELLLTAQGRRDGFPLP